MALALWYCLKCVSCQHSYLLQPSKLSDEAFKKCRLKLVLYLWICNRSSYIHAPLARALHVYSANTDAHSTSNYVNEIEALANTNQLWESHVQLYMYDAMYCCSKHAYWALFGFYIQKYLQTFCRYICRSVNDIKLFINLSCEWMYGLQQSWVKN